MSRQMLVTGATGMLGSYVVAAALDRGWRVRALVRDPTKAGWLEARGVELSTGDLLSAASLRRAAQRCDAVVHAAAVIGTGGSARRFRQGNVIGTDNVFEAAAWAGAHLVHVSSTAVFGAARYRETPTDEDAPLPVLPAWDTYGRSKQEAERLVLAQARERRVRVTVVRPPVMYGRRDRQFVPRVAPLLRFGVAPLPGGGETTLPLVHASSVAQGILAALERARAHGRIYHLTEDRPVTVRDLWTGASRGLDRPLCAVRLPEAAAAVGFTLLGAVLRIGRRGDLARHARGTHHMLTRPNPFSAERARRELGWRPPVEPLDALAEAFRWWATRRSEVAR